MKERIITACNSAYFHLSDVRNCHLVEISVSRKDVLADAADRGQRREAAIRSIVRVLRPSQAPCMRAYVVTALVAVCCVCLERVSRHSMGAKGAWAHSRASRIESR